MNTAHDASGTGWLFGNLLLHKIPANMHIGDSMPFEKYISEYWRLLYYHLYKILFYFLGLKKLDSHIFMLKCLNLGLKAHEHIYK